MRLTSTLAGFVLAVLAGASALATDKLLPPPRMAIHVQSGDWGNAQVQDIEKVLASVAEVLLPYFPQRASDRVRVVSSSDGPRVLLEKSPDGAHLVYLDVQDTRWNQFAYQFSHELCHIFSNYDHRRPDQDGLARDHQWFEEALCETVSLFALGRLASSWEQVPPKADWKNYAAAFREYANRLLNEKHRYLPMSVSMDAWFKANQGELESDPYLRKKNELLATLLLPLFEDTPGSVEAIGYLNLEKSSSPGSFKAYLEAWYSCCPEKNRPFVRKLITLIGGPPHGESAVAALTSSGALVQ